MMTSERRRRVWGISGSLSTRSENSTYRPTGIYILASQKNCFHPLSKFFPVFRYRQKFPLRGGDGQNICLCRPKIWSIILYMKKMGITPAKDLTYCTMSKWAFVFLKRHSYIIFLMNMFFFVYNDFLPCYSSFFLSERHDISSLFPIIFIRLSCFFYSIRYCGHFQSLFGYLRLLYFWMFIFITLHYFFFLFYQQENSANIG